MIGVNPSSMSIFNGHPPLPASCLPVTNGLMSLLPCRDQDGGEDWNSHGVSWEPNPTYPPIFKFFRQVMGLELILGTYFF